MQTLPILTTFVVLALLQAGMLYALFTGSGGPVPFEVRRLYLGAGVLFYLGTLLILAVAVYVWGPSAPDGKSAPGAVIFDSFIKIVPPILTSILGYYFGSMQMTAETRTPNVDTTANTSNAVTKTVRAFVDRFKDDESYAPIDPQEYAPNRELWRWYGKRKVARR